MIDAIHQQLLETTTDNEWLTSAWEFACLEEHCGRNLNQTMTRICPYLTKYDNFLEESNQNTDYEDFVHSQILKLVENEFPQSWTLNQSLIDKIERATTGR